MYNLTIGTTENISDSNIYIGDYIIDKSTLNISSIILGNYYSETNLIKAFNSGIITEDILSMYRTVSEQYENGDIPLNEIFIVPLTEIPPKIIQYYDQSIEYLKSILIVYTTIGTENIITEVSWVGNVEGVENEDTVDGVIDLYNAVNKLIIIKFL